MADASQASGQPGGGDGSAERDPPPGQVVDPAVMAERRARRAELAEQATVEQLAQAEQALVAMSARLAELEDRLGRVAAERSEAEAALEHRERALSDAVQRIYVERHTREEALEDARRQIQEAEERAEREAAQRDVLLDGAQRGLSAARETVAAARARFEEVEGEAGELRGELEAERARRLSVEAALERASATGPRGGDPALRDLVTSAGTALEQAERGIAEARAASTRTAEELEAERAARQRGEAELRRERWHARQLEVQVERERTARNALERGFEARLAQLSRDLGDERRARTAAETAGERARRRADALASASGRKADGPWLARAARVMAREDAQESRRLLVGLLAGQALATGRDLDYDVMVEGGEVHAVRLAAGRGTVSPISAARPAAEVDFRLELDAASLVELLAQGGSRRLRRHGLARVEATRRPARALRALPPVPMDLGTLARAGVWVDPRLACRALTCLMDPRWTLGHRFAVDYEVTGRRGDSWRIAVDDGARPLLTAATARDQARASVRLSPAALADALAEPRPPSSHRPDPPADKPAIRGDLRAVALLARWAQWAQAPAGAMPA